MNAALKIMKPMSRGKLLGHFYRNCQVQVFVMKNSGQHVVMEARMHV